jgi:hypothetical protein|nr:MAG TPA: hypothetical protein [Caudoviricetes sp.]
MTKEFLLQCEKKIEEAYKCAATDQGDKVNDIVREVSRDILLKISDSVTPVSEGTLPYIVASLRVLANALSKELDPLDKEYAKVLQILMGRIQFEREVERV